MQVTGRRVVLFSAGIAALAVVVLALNPWAVLAGYRVSYLRVEAVELAQAIDSRGSVRLRGEWWPEHVEVVVEASKPREEPLRIHVEYTRLVAPSPTAAREAVRGRPGRSFERFRRTAVYFNSTHLIVDPKPYVKVVDAAEYGRTVHIVKITIFTVTGQLKPQCIASWST